MASDPASGQLILFGGVDNSGTTYLNDTWNWTGADWKQITGLPDSPPARDQATMAFDPKNGLLVLFGGWNGTNLFDTWTWDGNTWSSPKLIQSVTPVPPLARSFASMAFDPASGELVLFGGIGDNNQFFADTWTWDGTAWTNLNLSVSPSQRYGAPMEFDPASGQLLLFGGNSQGT
jgi:hypothetical protein